MPPPLHKRVKRAIRSVLVRAAVALVALLPLNVALALGAAVGRIAWRVAPANRRRMLASLEVAFPERSQAEREGVARAALVHLGMVAAEVAAARRWAPDLESYVRMSPAAEAAVRRAAGRGKGVVVVAGHIGNWEAMARRLARVVSPTAVIAKRNADERLNAVVGARRREAGVETLWRDDPGTARALIRLFREGGSLGLLIDQDTKVQGVFVPFFGRLAFTPRAAADLALRFGAAVLVATTHRRGPRRGDGHEIDVVEVPYDPHPPDREAEVIRLTAACAALQESAIRAHPDEWVWMHERWRTRPSFEGFQAREMPETRGLSGA